MITLPLDALTAQLPITKTHNPNQINVDFQGVTIDSREIQTGNLFVALPGARVDGHQFLTQAQEQGAVAALVETIQPELHLPQFQVDNTLLVLAKLAHYWRNQFQCKFIAITGSNGKTTTKTMLTSILQTYCQDPQRVLSTPKNYNTLIGVSLTLFQLNAHHQFAVIEMGMNRAGEIAQLVELCQPQVSLLTNASPTHLDELKTIENVAKAKGEIFQSAADSYAIINDDDHFTGYWQALARNTGKKVLLFSRHHEQGVASYATDMDPGKSQFQLHTPIGNHKVQLQLPGIHNIENALAAASAAYALGLPLDSIVNGLAKTQAIAGRMQTYYGLNKVNIIDCTYKANISAFDAALQILTMRTGQKIVVFADMGELGPQVKSQHLRVGELCSEQGVDVLYTVGEASHYAQQTFSGHKQHFSDKATLIENLLPFCKPDNHLLIIGSRFMKMETVIDAIKQKAISV